MAPALLALPRRLAHQQVSCEFEARTRLSLRRSHLLTGGIYRPPSDPSGKKAVALANHGNSQLTTASPSEATFDETSNIPVHPHVYHASLVVDHAEADKQSTELFISQRLWL